MIVCLKLAQYIVFTMSCVDLTHQYWISGSHIYKLIFHLLQILVHLIHHFLDAIFVYRTDFFQKTQCMRAASHIVLVDVVNHVNIVVDKSADQSSDTPHFLHCHAVSERTTLFSECVQEFPIVKSLFMRSIKRKID